LWKFAIGGCDGIVNVCDGNNKSTVWLGAQLIVTEEVCKEAEQFTPKYLSAWLPRKNLKFYLSARCGREKDRFGLFLHRAAGSETCTLDFELAVMKKSSRQFESKLTVNNHTLGVDGRGMPNPLDITWTELMSDDSDYFIDGILRSLEAMGKFGVAFFWRPWEKFGVVAFVLHFDFRRLRVQNMKKQTLQNSWLID
ncbi:hypothetical protein V2J09_011689, partial [Rumex salicifolius]